MAANTNERCNGWTNWATWNVNLWMENDELSYKELSASAPFTAESAKGLVLRLYPGGTPDMDDPSDLEAVNWPELAAAWNEPWPNKTIDKVVDNLLEVRRLLADSVDLLMPESGRFEEAPVCMFVLLGLFNLFTSIVERDAEAARNACGLMGRLVEAMEQKKLLS